MRTNWCRSLLIAHLSVAATALQNVQHHTGLRGRPVAAEAGLVAERFSWTAKAWEDCVRGPNGVSFRTRAVRCMSIFSGNEAVGEHRCAVGSKPCPFARCHCGAVPCVGKASFDATCFDEESTYEEPEPEFVGCIGNPPLSPAVLGPDDDETLDLSCMKCSGQCHAGLSFFRKDLGPGASHFSCSKFCRSMGMDLSGLRPDQICLCGATKLNKGIFHLGPPRDCLLLKRPDLREPFIGSCDVQVFRYSGSYWDESVPPHFVATRDQDDAYIDSIIMGKPEHNRFLDNPRREDTGENIGTGGTDSLAAIRGLEAKVMAKRKDTPSWKRHCWPSNCASGAGPFQRRQTQPPPGVADRYQEYVIVHYVFAENIDAPRKDAFRLAVERFSMAACVNLIEVDTLDDPTTFDLKVVFEDDQCWAQGFGEQKKENAADFAKINLGWCNHVGQVGTVIHEIGHFLGMNHEQQRPDAANEYFGHGPYLHVNWDNVDSHWDRQWEPDYTSYTGSADDGDGDSHIGYAAYDFDSIMHYAVAPKIASTDPPEARKLTGNRRFLSTSDVYQLWDMYQCRFRTGSTTTSTTLTYPHFSITLDWGRYDWTGLPVSCELSEDKLCIQSANYPEAYSSKQRCTFEAAVGPIALQVDAFNTEWNFDFLYVHERGYSGRTGPQGAVVQPGDQISWTSDWSAQADGWKICAVPAPPPAPPSVSPTPSPTAPPTESATPSPTAPPTESPTPSPSAPLAEPPMESQTVPPAYVLGEQGVDACPTGYVGIHDIGTCEEAAATLGLLFEAHKCRDVGDERSFCFYCAGCAFPHVKVATNYGWRANFICLPLPP